MTTKRILLLGSGYVAGPCVQYLLRNPTNHLVIASFLLEQAQALAKRHESSRISVTHLDLNDTASLDKLVAENDLVISLVPYTFHPLVIQSAIKHQKDVVTTSYVSPEMMELDEAAKKAGITVMNEIGLDPGVDHVYALKVINEAHAKGSKILSFESFCGGLPAPEASDNPLGYKFSWSSRGVLLALRNSAKFLRDGKVVEIEGSELMKSAQPIDIDPAFETVGYANRDSSFYNERYNIPEAQTVIRGTLRYSVFPGFIQTLVDLGFLDDTPKDYLKDVAPEITWRQVLGKVIGIEGFTDSQLQKHLTKSTNLGDLSSSEQSHIISGLSWLGLTSDTNVTKTASNLLDTLCATLEAKMAYGPGERDMVLLQHKFLIEHSNGAQETVTSTLLEYGDPNEYSAMARNVGVPSGVAAQLVLDGKLNTPGILAPITEDVVNLFLPELIKENIICVEKTL